MIEEVHLATALRSPLRSLSARLLLPLLAIVSAALAVHAAVSFHSTERRFEELVGAEAHRLARVILQTTHDRMLVDPQVDVQRTMERLAEGGGVTHIRLYDGGGRIAQSSRTGEIGQRVEKGADPCLSCHATGASPRTRARQKDLVAWTAAGPVLRHLTVIPNEASCSAASCHPGPAVQPQLGVLDVELSMGPLEDALHTARRQTWWTMGLLVLLSGGVSGALIQRLVHRPVRQIHEGTRRIARGELDQPIEVRGHDELAELATAFNGMVAEVKAAREEMTDWSRRLEEKVVEKGEELQRAQRQVLHMERMASLGKLAATVAHEVNNPLSGILTYARLVERELTGQSLPGDVAEELRQHLRLIAQECTRCGTIVRNLLLFARHSGGEMAPVDVNQVVERSLALMRHHLEIHDIALECALLPEGREVVADGAQLEQALLALMVNAVEAMTGGGRGGVLGVRLEGDSGSVTVHLSDTGVGIHPDVVPHIFEPFFSTKDETSGVGLGLAVVYGIVQRHGGTIEVDSEPGRGTTFHLRLPRRPRGEAEPRA